MGLHWADLIVFAAFMCISLVTGLYHALQKRFRATSFHETTSDFLMGDRKMPIIPIMLSVVTTFLSGLTILGAPADIYERGFHFLWLYWSIVVALVVTAVFFLPVFYELKLTSIYEYLELRFQSKLLRIVGSCLFAVSTILYMGVVIYAPSIALSGVTGVSLWPFIIGTGFVCTIYTTAGGLKAVVWTDTIQAVFMYAGLTMLLVKGVIDAGGINTIWQVSKDSQRLDTFFELNPDPTLYNSTLIAFFGGIFYWLSAYGLNQMAQQRYCSLPSLKDGQWVIALTVPAFMILGTMACLIGPISLAYFKSCNLVADGTVQSRDQIIVYFALRVLESIPGLFGLFLATLFSGTLSSVSSGMNSMAAVLWEDVIKARFPNMSDSAATQVNRLIVGITGILATMIAAACLPIGGMIRAIMLFLGAFGAPLAGLFILGVMVPFASRRGAIASIVVSMCLSVSMFIGGFLFKPHGNAMLPPGPMCNSTNSAFNTSTLIDSTPGSVGNNQNEIFILFRFSPFLFTAISSLSVVFFGCVFSCIWPNEHPVDSRLVAFGRSKPSNEKVDGLIVEMKSDKTDRITSL